MLRSLLSGVLASRSRAPMGGGYGARGYGRRGAVDPRAEIGMQVGRSLFSALRRR